MYCPVCGAESTQGLNYCKRCGASLGTAPVQVPQSVQSTRTLPIIFFLIAALVLVCAGGLGISLGIGGALASNGIRFAEGPLAIILCGSLVVLVVSVMLLRLLSRVLTMHAAGISTTPPAGQLTDLSRLVAQIQAPSTEAPSVTEHTTRTMDKSLYSGGQRS